ncbi:chromosome segregation protein Spc25-domain-containing protein [Helicostylum pulchrum]|nr:chromosome segregation protein Spc25-domain-containing protein [Helicostylum pulchrum]
MEEIDTSRLCADINETLNTFRLLEISFRENLVKERRNFEEAEEAFEKQFTQLSEMKNAFIKNIEFQSNTISEYEKKLAKSKELSVALELSNYKVESETVSKESEKLQALVDQKLAILEEKKVENISKKASTLENERRDKNELMACVKYTQLDMSTEKENHVKFSFKSISQVDTEKVFYFVLYLSESNIFRVTECQPEIPEMDSLLAEVNIDRDIYSFVKRVRRSFVEVNKLSSASYTHPKEN